MKERRRDRQRIAERVAEQEAGLVPTLKRGQKPRPRSRLPPLPSKTPAPGRPRGAPDEAFASSVRGERGYLSGCARLIWTEGVSPLLRAEIARVILLAGGRRAKPDAQHGSGRPGGDRCERNRGRCRTPRRLRSEQGRLPLPTPAGAVIPVTRSAPGVSTDGFEEILGGIHLLPSPSPPEDGRWPWPVRRFTRGGAIGREIKCSAYETRHSIYHHSALCLLESTSLQG